MPFIYKDSKLVTLQRKGSRILTVLLSEFASAEHLFPADHRELFNAARDDRAKIQVCCDYIAGMTDEYALHLYQRLFESERGVLTDFF
jgi:dGTPase